MTDSMNKAKLIAIAVVVVLAGFALANSRADGQGLRKGMDLVGMSVPFQERAGSDDGTAFAIQFMGDTHGVLEPCG